MQNSKYTTLADSVRAELFAVDLSTSTDVFGILQGDATDTIWNRLTKLAQGFKDGVLTLAGFKADKVETDELCIGDTCVSEAQLKALLQQSQNPGGGGGGDTPPPPDPTPDPTPDPDPIPDEGMPSPDPVPDSTTPPDPVPDGGEIIP